MNFFAKLAVVAAISTSFASCTNMHNSMREPNSRVEFVKNDFTFSAPLSGEATSTRIFGIDFKRLFKKTSGSVEGASAGVSGILASVPIIGATIVDPTANYALYELMNANPGYDVVFYPQYQTTVKRPIGLGFIVKKTTVKVTARLGKIN
jgi:hypothetical protein